MKNIAIVVVAYNRVTSLNRLLNSLLQADVEDAPLIISIDKSNTDTVERFANNFIWPFGEKKVITHDKNLGLRTHILSVGDWLDMYDAIIVLEDDIVVTPGFYRYAVSAYSYYQIYFPYPLTVLKLFQETDVIFVQQPHIVDFIF